ncbi:hypothetical protein JR316_0009297 [Psilocybe cubensis]|uniref:Uncharacterized protein n=2 Tax=Psilocybe cubensis TaxID=181762 RepID=A0A8H8CKJ0_PSICU|nr:hypothetical protein JR316_0009297 [Psilocybe cubensis]KAH9478835.1 hypothetical protein JR316_0009297 [Psilocybe cubensis]
MSNSGVSQSVPTASEYTSQYHRTEQSVYEDSRNVQQNPKQDFFESSGWNEVEVDDHGYQETYLDNLELPLVTPSDANPSAGTRAQAVLQIHALNSQIMPFSHTIKPSTFTQSSLYGSTCHGTVPVAREDVLNSVGKTLHPAEHTPGHSHSGDDLFHNLRLDMFGNTPFPSQPIPQAPQDSFQHSDTPSALLPRDYVELAKELPALNQVIEKWTDPLLEVYVATGTINPALLALPGKTPHLQVPPHRREKVRDLGRYTPYGSLKRHSREYVPSESVNRSSSSAERDHNAMPPKDKHPPRTRFRPFIETEAYPVNDEFQHTESNEAKGSGFNSVDQRLTSGRSGPEDARSHDATPRASRGRNSSKKMGSSSESAKKRGRTARDGSATQPHELDTFDNELTMEAQSQRTPGAASAPRRPRAVVARLDFVTGEVMSQGKRTDKTKGNSSLNATATYTKE